MQALLPKHPGRGVNPQRLSGTGWSLPALPFWGSSGRHHLHLPLSALCFHNLTNCFSRKLLLFTTIRIARGCGAAFQNSGRTDAMKKTTSNTKFATPASPFNALYRHSMHRNTIQRKVWSHKANSGRLDAESLGGSAQFNSICRYICGLRGGTISRAVLRVKNAGCDEDVAVESAKL